MQIEVRTCLSYTKAVFIEVIQNTYKLYVVSKIVTKTRKMYSDVTS